MTLSGCYYALCYMVLFMCLSQLVTEILKKIDTLSTAKMYHRDSTFKRYPVHPDIRGGSVGRLRELFLLTTE